MLQRIVDRLRASLPNEGCGLLAERPVGGGWTACRYYPGENVDRSPHRFTMDPRAVVDALRDIEARGWRLAAIVHSHPVGPATPSETDLGEAYYPDAAFLIVGFGGSEPEVRAWRLVGAAPNVVEVAVVGTGEARAAAKGQPVPIGRPS